VKSLSDVLDGGIQRGDGGGGSHGYLFFFKKNSTHMRPQ